MALAATPRYSLLVMLMAFLSLFPLSTNEDVHKVIGGFEPSHL
jgi:hypothetical protein